MARAGDKGGENTWNTMLLNEGRNRVSSVGRFLPSKGCQTLVSSSAFKYYHAAITPTSDQQSFLIRTYVPLPDSRMWEAKAG